jgi:hypothetical protein
MLENKLQPQLQPLKAKIAGKLGRKHTIGRLALIESGQAGVYFECFKPECGCSGYYTLEELGSIAGHFNDGSDGEGKEVTA